MIIASFCRTKPSKATANPVNALYSDITTGMSAPPIGSVIIRPNKSASTKNATMRGEVSCPVTSITPMTTAAARTAMFTARWPGNTKRLSSQPWSLAKAMSDPEKLTAPINAPSTASDSCAVSGPAPSAVKVPPSSRVTALALKPNSSAAPMAAAAPPPMPL